MHLYYIPSAPSDAYYNENAASVSLSEPLCDGVLLDMLSGKVFALPHHVNIQGRAVYNGLPLSNYPLLITERGAIEIEKDS
jgi:hypothetical protein